MTILEFFPSEERLRSLEFLLQRKDNCGDNMIKFFKTVHGVKNWTEITFSPLPKHEGVSNESHGW